MRTQREIVLSENTTKRILRKETERGRIKEMNTLHYHRELYPTDEHILKQFFDARRRKSGNECPDCKRPIDKFYKKVPAKSAFRCSNCCYRVYPLVGTPFEHTHMSLRLMLELVFRMLQSKHGLTAAEVARDYGMSEDCAWRLLHRNRRWMALALEQEVFDPNGYLEMDEVYPKKPTRLGRKYKWSRGMGSQRIAKVITMIERGGPAKAFVVERANNSVVRGLLNKYAKKTNKIFTDESRIYRSLKDEWTHGVCNHNEKEWVNGSAHTNTCESLNSYIKGNIYHTHKGVKYLQQYVDETTFRFSTRFETVQEAISRLFAALPPLSVQSADETLQEIIKQKPRKKAS